MIDIDGPVTLKLIEWTHRLSQLESIMRNWLSYGGKEKIRADVESINHAAERFIWRLARKHDIKVEGLLELTADIYRPVRKDDWSEEILHVIDQYLTLSFWEEVFCWLGNFFRWLSTFGHVADLHFTVSYRQPKLIAIDKQSDDDVMHVGRSGKTDRLAG